MAMADEGPSWGAGDLRLGSFIEHGQTDGTNGRAHIVVARHLYGAWRGQQLVCDDTMQAEVAVNVIGKLSEEEEKSPKRGCGRDGCATAAACDVQHILLNVTTNCTQGGSFASAVQMRTVSGRAGDRRGTAGYGR